MKTFQAMIDAGKPVPPQYDEIPDRPDVAVHLTGIWNEFFELSTERQIGMAAGQIPASKIRERAREIGHETEAEIDRFYFLIRQMDAVYLAPKADNAEGDDNAVTAADGTKRPMKRLAVKTQPSHRKRKKL